MIRYCQFDGLDVAIDTMAPVEACGAKKKSTAFGPYPTGVPMVFDKHQMNQMRVPNPINDIRYQSSVKTAEQIINVLGDELFSYCTICGPITLAGELRGLINLLMDLNNDSRLVKDLLEYCVDTTIRYILDCVNLDIDGVVISEPLISRFHFSKEQVDTFFIEPIQQCIDVVKKSGKYVIIHLCGESREILGSIPTDGIDILSIEFDLLEIPTQYQEITIMGNLSADVFMSQNPSQVLQKSLECIDIMKGRKYILSAGCALPLNSKIENVSILRYASEYHHLYEP